MASNIFRGYNYLFSPNADPLFACAIGLAAATLRIRREETCHRLGLPSNSMISLVEQERTKFDDTPTSRSRLAMSSWSLGDSREANLIRQDTLRTKRRAMLENQSPNQATENPPSFSSAPLAPQLSRHPQTGELILAPPPASNSGSDGSYDSDEQESTMSQEEIRRRDEEFKSRFKEAQPAVSELATMFASRTSWFVKKCWVEYRAKPWFWQKWGRGWESWRTQRSDKVVEMEKARRRGEDF